MKYQVRYKRGSTFWTNWYDVNPGGGSSESLTIHGLVNGTAYSFEVRAASHDRANRQFRFGPKTTVAATPDATAGPRPTFTVDGLDVCPSASQPLLSSLQERLKGVSCKLASTDVTYYAGGGMTPESAAVVTPLLSA